MSLPRRQTQARFASSLPAFRTDALANTPPLVRLAPWLILVAVLFLFIFLPFGLVPELSRRADLGTRLDAARSSALQAEQLAASVARAASEAPTLKDELARAEAWMVRVDALSGLGTILARHAQESGVALLAVGYGPFMQLAAAEKPGTGQAGANPPLPYGRVSLDVTAQGSWSGLARFAGLLETSTPGLRVTSWSVSGGSAQGTYQLRLSGVLYVNGRPPVSAAIGNPPARASGQPAEGR